MPQFVVFIEVGKDATNIVQLCSVGYLRPNNSRFVRIAIKNLTDRELKR
jgi:hypothetical protein